MNTIKLSDITMKQVADGFSLSFKEKIELAKLLDKLGVSVIELEGIVQTPVTNNLNFMSGSQANITEIHDNKNVSA
jgi:isopropylmalate/homocitrate/citramalate synthase